MNPDFFEDGSQRTAWYKTGNGTPLLILHGWGSRSELMMPLAESLGRERTSYLIDFPGFGASPEPAVPWSVSDYADLTADFIDRVVPGGKTDVLVHSYGCRVVLKLLANPETASKIGKVIITGGAGLKPRRKPGYYFRKYAAKLLKLPFMVLPGTLRERSLNWLRTTPVWKSLGSSDYQSLSGVMRQTFVKSVTEHLDALLPRIEHEALLIWGQNDMATPPDQGKRMEAGLKNGTLIEIQNAGHYAFLDQPAQFTAIVKAYLSPGN